MSVRLGVDADRCRGHAICALLLPEHVDIDEWGFPLIAPVELVGARPRRRAHRAVRACPRHALRLVEEEPSGDSAKL